MAGDPLSFATEIRPFGPDAIARAARLITAGETVAVPTETVYGLAADATNGVAVARIYAAKGRPAFNPLIVHVASIQQAAELVEIDNDAQALGEAFWPGPLTLVLPVRNDSPVASLVTAGLPTLAIRIPAHRAMRALIEATGKPLAAPSANASGAISPTRADHVLATLEGRLPLIVDDGATSYGLESTILAVESDGVRELRPGPVTAEDIVQRTGMVVLENRDHSIRAPGQLESHYAPRKPLRLNASNASPDEWLIGFGAVAGNAQLSEQSNLLLAASRLFDLLYEADAQDRPRIAIAPIPLSGIGVAINDRLSRAATPRSAA